MDGFQGLLMPENRKDPEQVRFVNLAQGAAGTKPGFQPLQGQDVFSMPKGFRRKMPDPAGIPDFGERSEIAPAAPNKNGAQFALPAPFRRQEKKNAGGLSAAREHQVPDFFPGQLSKMKCGPVRIEAMNFQESAPIVDLRTVNFNGFARIKGR